MSLDPNRIPPTDEDAAIFVRNLDRWRRWEAKKPLAWRESLLALARFCGDYLERKP